MKNKICTSIEQSKKLIELGIDVNIADMYWEYDTFQKFYRLELFEDGFPKTITKDDIPAWSLSALLKIIPSPLSFGYTSDCLFSLKKFPTFPKDKSTQNFRFFADYPQSINSFTEKEPVDAVFKMLVWLKENKKI